MSEEHKDENKTVMLQDSELKPLTEKELAELNKAPESQDNKTVMLQDSDIELLSNEELREKNLAILRTEVEKQAAPRPKGKKKKAQRKKAEAKPPAVKPSTPPPEAKKRPIPKPSSGGPKATDTSGTNYTGTIDGRYMVGDCLGQGAMGSVYKVKHIKLAKRFAMKIIHPQLAREEMLVARFHREAQALSRLDHPNCVGVVDFGQTGRGDFYLVMDYVEGEDLAEIVSRGPLPIDTAIEITKQVLRGLGHAHKAGILHRDIKLENLIKTEDEDGFIRIKILDFGLAKDDLSDEQQLQLTQAGVLIGTPQYLAPEIIETQVMNQQTDLYAVGITLIRMLIGGPVWQGTDIAQVLKNKLDNPHPKLTTLSDTEFPDCLERFLSKAIDEPDKRFATAAEMLTALNEVSKEIARHNNKKSIIDKEKWQKATAAAVKGGSKATEFVVEQSKHLGRAVRDGFNKQREKIAAADANPLESIARNTRDFVAKSVQRVKKSPKVQKRGDKETK